MLCVWAWIRFTCEVRCRDVSINYCVHDKANVSIAYSPERRRDGGCIFLQRLLYFIDILVGWLTNNRWDIFDREFRPNVFDQHRHPT